MGDFPARIATQEFWSSFGFWVLFAGLIGEIIVLAIPVYRGRLDKVLSGIFTIVVIIGCAFEHVADNRISTLISQEEAAAGIEIASAKNSAASAIEAAAKLGISQQNLHDFVSLQERQNSAAIGELQHSAADLNKARDDAVLAAKATEGDLAKMAALLTQESDLRAKIEKLVQPRQISDAKINEMAERLRPFANQQWEVTPYWDVKESLDLANQIYAVLDKAKWVYKEHERIYGDHRDGYRGFRGLSPTSIR